MESKEQLFQMIEKGEADRRRYLEALFKYIPEAVIRELTYKEYEKDEIILHAGQNCDSIYFLLTGQVIGLEHQKMGRVYSFMDFTKMNVLGDFEAFSDQPCYGVTVCAASTCSLLKVSTSSYLKWIKHDENALYLRLNHILTTLSSERKMDRSYIFMDSKERLVSYLVNLYDSKTENKKASFKVSRTQGELADKIGANVRSVQRSIAALEKAGLISLENGKIVISEEQYLLLKEQIKE